jgi:hypothetical protein
LKLAATTGLAPWLLPARSGVRPLPAVRMRPFTVFHRQSSFALVTVARNRSAPHAFDLTPFVSTQISLDTS